MNSPRQPRLRSSRPSFADEHGWGWGAIKQALGAVHWLGPRAEEEATIAARRSVGRAVRSITTWARGRSASLPQAIRNLAAEASHTDLPLWWLVTSADGVWPDDVAAELAPLAAALEEFKSPEAGLLATILRGDDFPDGALEDLLGEASMKPLDRRLGRHLREQAPLTAAELVAVVLEEGEWLEDRQRLQLLKRAAHYYPPSEPLSLDDCDALPRDDVALLARWPHLLRILEGRGVAPDDGRTPKARIPLDGLAAVLRTRQLEHRNRALDAAIAALAVRASTSPAFSALASVPGLGSIPAEYLDRFRDALSVETDLRVPSATVSSAWDVAARLPGPVALAVKFVLQVPNERVARLRSASVGDRNQVLQMLHPSELVATLAAPGLGRDDARLLVKMIEEAGAAPPVIAAITGIGESGIHAVIPPIPDAVYADWLESADADEIDDAQRDVLVRRGLPDLRPSRETLHSLARQDLVDLPRETTLRLLLHPEMVNGLRGIDEPTWERLYGKVVELIADIGWHSGAPSDMPGSTLLDVALASFPRLALERLAADGSLLDQDIASCVPTDVLAEWLEAADDRPGLASLAEAATRTQRPLPEALAQVALDHRELMRATLAVSRSSLPLEQVVERGLESRETGTMVDALVPADERWSVLPWVRERYADRPGVAVAHEIAVAFGLSYAGLLRHLAGMVTIPLEEGQAGHQFDHLYRTYELPKKRGGNRTITVPQRVLRGLQRDILLEGFEVVPVHPAATGFRKGRSILDNAAPHERQPIVVNIDIKSFFPSTRYESIVRACRQLGDGRLSPAAVRLVADICAYDGGLPIGAPTSPAIANVILRGVDAALTTVAARRGVTYTRYADDLTFSGDDGALSLIPFARRLLLELGYHLDRRKTNIYRRGRRQIVTSLVVNERADLPRRTRRRLRAALHRREHAGKPEWHGRPMDDPALMGWLAFAAMLRPEEGATALAHMRDLVAMGAETP